MFGFSAAKAVVSIQVGYCISDIISKCGVSIVIYKISYALSGQKALLQWACAWGGELGLTSVVFQVVHTLLSSIVDVVPLARAATYGNTTCMGPYKFMFGQIHVLSCKTLSFTEFNETLFRKKLFVPCWLLCVGQNKTYLIAFKNSPLEASKWFTRSSINSWLVWSWL